MRYSALITAALVCGLLAGTALPGLHAQPGGMRLTKGKVTAILDTFSGRFSAAGADGKTMLFGYGKSPTSHVSVVIDGTIWTNYGKSVMYAPYPQRNLGRGKAARLADRLRYTWEVRARGGTVRIVQELEPVSDSLYEEMRIHLVVENAGARAVDAGMTVMEDVDAAGDDDVTLRHLSVPYTRERSFTGAAIPERLVMMSDAFAPDSAHCRNLGHALTDPDVVTLGRWYYHSGLGTAVYGYTASPQPIADAAVLLQWNKEPLVPGARREEVTAIGFTAPAPEGKGASTFAHELIIPMSSPGTFVSIVSDTTATVNVSAPYTDAVYERADLRNGSWDTTIIATPSRPGSVFIWLSNIKQKNTDSVSWYRQRFAFLRSDMEISAIIRPNLLYFAFDAATVWPVLEWDTEYLFHGVLDNGDGYIHNGRESNRITIQPTIEYDALAYTRDMYYPVGKPINYHLPSDGFLHIQKGFISYPGYNPWNPGKFSERDSSSDGAGDLVRGTQPFLLTIGTQSKILPGMPRGEGWTLPAYETHFTIEPSRAQLGTEYIFVPFRKSGAVTQNDFVRIIAYEDGTDLTLIDGSAPMRLDRQEHVDTLLGAPTVIRSSKLVAIYQHQLTWSYLRTDDTTFYGGAFALLPHGLWGRRYYPVDDDGTSFNSWPKMNALSDYHELRYDNHYYILISKAKSRDGIFIDDVPVDASQFTVFGEWAYAYIDMPLGFHRVRSDHPFLTISCGGGYGPWGRWIQSFGMSYIPPFR